MTQSPLMSATMDGWILQENASITNSSEDTRGTDAVPTDNPFGDILGASQETSDEKESCAAPLGEVAFNKMA